MPDKKISQLVDGGASQALDAYVIARTDGVNYKIAGTAIAAAATSVGTLSSLAVSGDLTVDTSTLKVDSTNNRVGVGTASPSVRFDVSDTAVVQRLISTGSSASDEPRLRFFHTGNDEFEIRGGDGLKFYGSSANLRMTLTSSGNLGLGVTPSAWGTSEAMQFANGFSYGKRGHGVNGYYDGTAWKYIDTGYASLYQQGGGTHTFYTAGVGSANAAITFTQAMTLDASGNLGVGTTSILGRFTVAGGYSYVTDDGTRRLVMGPDGTGVLLGTSTNHYLRFLTNDAERARITTAGELCVGATGTNASERLIVRGVGATNATYITVFENSSGSRAFSIEGAGRIDTGTLGDSPYNYVVGGTNRDLYVDNTGKLGYVSSVLASKTNIAPVTDANWLLNLNPVTFNFRKKDEDGNYTDEADGPLKHGLIAEEVEAVNPDLCFYDDEASGGALRGVNYTHLITPMLKLVQAQQAKIESLEARLAALES